MNICYCGTEAGYPHKTECPYPFFRGTEAQERDWYKAAGYCPECGNTPPAHKSTCPNDSLARALPPAIYPQPPDGI